ncbi:uncharacterized protein EV154DRAFT_568924 [Mucor mucedo]|uniref:uncharacterized protein n=1 Tax=Mucor mucedo TaxID=29922 RepID=UPI00221F6C7B|nr:uncharacterized protein EV154DRAFT_568924 [Mucor mucedo]KAI7878386.1 hypothetical protein EV154DRAFT_568924 [Mucor mucedo]
MNTLPTQILITIFLHVKKNDRLQCILVCKKWFTLITENVLYENLQFRNIDIFDKAIDLFDKQPAFGSHVESLTIQSCDIDMMSVFSMPRYFPNLKFLDWKEDIRPTEERLRNDLSTKELPRSLVYQRELRKWNQLESIDVRLEKLPFLTMLLESSSLDSLTSVKISFKPWHVDDRFGSETMIKLRPIVKSLISNIKSAPSLELLVMKCAVLDLSDMEELHASVPKLKSLDLFCTAISGGATDDWLISTNKKSVLDNNGMAVTPNTASTVTELSITFYNTISGIHSIQGDLKYTMKKWLIYLGCKYNDAEINLKGRGIPCLPEISNFYEPMVTIIRKGTNSTRYHAFLYPITKSIMNAIGDRKVELKSLHIYSSGTIQALQKQLNIVKLSRQAKTITGLEINSRCLLLKESLAWSVISNNLSVDYFQSLSILSVNCTIHHCALTALFQTLPPLLQTLFLRSIILKGDDKALLMMPTEKCKINSLYLGFSCKPGSTIHQMNYVLEFILQSCPSLTDFTLHGQTWSSDNSMLKLWFFDHNELKKITINFNGIQYYTFSLIEEKRGLRWANYDNLADSSDLTVEKIHMDISWRSKYVKLDLAKVPQKW